MKLISLKYYNNIRLNIILWLNQAELKLNELQQIYSSQHALLQTL